MIRMDIASMQGREVEKDIAKYVSNIITNRLGIKNKICKLAKKCNEVEKDTHILPHTEF